MKVAFAWVAFAVVIIGGWHLVWVTGVVSPAALASPYEVLLAFPRLFGPETPNPLTTGNRPDVWSTAWRSLFAFMVSVPVGVGLGFIVFFARDLAVPARVLLDFLRSVPATALVPVFIILVGIDDTTKVVVGAFSSALVIALSTVAGLQARNQTRVAVAEVLGVSATRRLYLLDLPDSAAQIFVGLRAGISLALVLVVVTEMLIGANRGLGKVISDMRFTDDRPKMYAAIIVTGALGYLYNYALIWTERRLIHWKGK